MQYVGHSCRAVLVNVKRRLNFRFFDFFRHL